MHATARIAPCMPANFPGITEGIKSPPTVPRFARLPESPLHTFQATNNPEKPTSWGIEQQQQKQLQVLSQEAGSRAQTSLVHVWQVP